MGATMLNAFLAEAGLTQAEFARLAGLAPVLVNQYIHGKRRPGIRSAFLIEYASKGRIPAKSWGEPGK